MLNTCSLFADMIVCCAMCDEQNDNLPPSYVSTLAFAMITESVLNQ
jgi:hypothetical protein